MNILDNAMDTLLDNNQIECFGWPAVITLMEQAMKLDAKCSVEKLNDDMYLVEVYR